MTQATTTLSTTPTAARTRDGELLLRGMTRTRLTPQQQLDALHKAQARAEQRVQLGVKLFKAAEHQLAAQSEAAQRIRQSQEALREKIASEVSQSLHSYDQWIGQVDDRITKAVETMNQRVETLEESWRNSEAKLTRLVEELASLIGETKTALQATQAEAAEALQARGKPAAANSTGSSLRHPPAATDDEAWNEIYHRALLWLGESDQRPAESEPKTAA